MTRLALGFFLASLTLTAVPIASASATPNSVSMRQRIKNVVGPTGAAGRLNDLTVFVPGHTMTPASMRRMAKHFLKNRDNGEFFAVFDAKKRTFRRNGARGQKLSEQQVREAKMVVLKFRNRFAGALSKSADIGYLTQTLTNLHNANEAQPLALNFVAHSAGTPQLEHAILKLPRIFAKVSVKKSVRIGSPSHGTFMGNLGNNALGSLIGMRDASAEMAQGSNFLHEIAANRKLINEKLGTVTDIRTPGRWPLTLAKSRRGLRLVRGDGFVAENDTVLNGASLDVVPVGFSNPLNHITQTRFAGVISKTDQALAK